MHLKIFSFDFQKCRKILNDTSVHKYHLSQKFMIIVTNGTTKNRKNSLNEIFNVLWINGLLHSQVLIRVTTKSPHTWSLYTFMPYQCDCFTLSEWKIASFTSVNYTNPIAALSMAQLFPKKLNNFNQCPLHVAVSTKDPLVVAGKNLSNGKLQYKGIEVDITTQISKMLNFNIIYERTKDGTNTGVILPNKTVTGNLKLVRKDTLLEELVI